MENISINKNLTNIFLINGTFPLDRLRIKVAASYSQKQTTKTKQKKNRKKKQKPKQFFFSISSITGKYCVFCFIIS